MISLIVGLPGSGKSLLLSYIAHRAVIGKKINFRGFDISSFKHYDYIYTNFPAEGCYKLDFDELGYSNYHDCLMLIDEVQLFADSRNFKNFGDNLKMFFSLHRKFKIDIVMCSQSHSAVDARLRSLTHKLYYVDSLGSFIRVREIIAYFDVHGTIQEGYDYARGFNTKYFYAPRLYKFNDTFHKIKEIDLHPVSNIPWVQADKTEAEPTNTQTEPAPTQSGGSSGVGGSPT